MIVKINDNISVWRDLNPFVLSSEEDAIDSSASRRTLEKIGFNQERISIQGRWFDVIPASALVRKRNQQDGYYRALYIQINLESGEYYIGKVNRPRWSEVRRYHGSGLKFVSKFKKYKDQFVRFYIATCETAEETEQLEASIVNHTLLADEKCLNLCAGGGGTSNRPSIAESSQKKREYMLSHPEQFASMLKASKEVFQSGDTPQLRARNTRIKEVMSVDKYREMSRSRIKNWMADNPEKYSEARKNNREAIKKSEAQAQRLASLKKWAEKHPEQHKAWQEKLVKSRTSPKASKKRKDSLKEWREKNPLFVYVNAQKRAKAAAAKRSKAVSMIDLKSGKTLKKFPSLHEAARWLVKTGKAKTINCVSSISSVCLRKPCTTGYGYRKKAYGYGWRYTEET